MTISRHLLCVVLPGAATCAWALPTAAYVTSGPVPSPYERSIADAKAVMMSDPQAALSRARAAIASARRLPAAKATGAYATGRWLEGEALTRLNRPDEAAPVIADALAFVTRSHSGTKLHADLLKAQAAITADNGDVRRAIETLHQAYAVFEKLGEARSQAIVLQEIGSIYADARDYPRMLRYYEQSAEIVDDDPTLTLTSHNNRGDAYKDLGNFVRAEAEYALALAAARSMNSPTLETRVLNNIASAQFGRGALAAAEATARAGLRRATGSAADWRPFLWGVRAQIAFARGDAAGAARLIDRTFRGVDVKRSTVPFRDFHEAAGAIYAALGDDSRALRHLSAFKRLDDEARNLAASANSALLSARFDAANQDLRIARLKAGQLSRDISLARSEQRLRSIRAYSAAGASAAALVIAGLLVGFAFLRRSRLQARLAYDHLTFASGHDGLTGLANRARFRGLLDDALVPGARSDCALLLIDLDRFKAVNDSMGHRAGDIVLCTVARRLEALDIGDAAFGRLGGDEFAVLLCGGHGSQVLHDIAESIIATLSAPCEIDGAHVTVGATIGYAVGPRDGASADVITRAADLALYRAKESGRGRSARYRPDMLDDSQERRSLEADLRVALVQGELAIAYQPIVDAQTQRMIAYEALLRWNHPTRGPVSPAVFVPIAEEAKLIQQIGTWVLRSACAEAMSWPADVSLAVNLSAIQVEGDELAATVMSALASSGLSPARLELEVTESIFLRQGPRTDATLDRLRKIGVSLALDDFGTGYSSLGYLQRASFSKIKIDRSFVQGAAGGCRKSMSIIQAIVALARGLDMQTTAEGVETEAETVMMRELGCSQLQGYLFGRPQEASAPDDPLRQVA